MNAGVVATQSMGDVGLVQTRRPIRVVGLRCLPAVRLPTAGSTIRALASVLDWFDGRLAMSVLRTENPEGDEILRPLWRGPDGVEPVRSSSVDVSDALRSFVWAPVADRLVQSGGTTSLAERLVERRGIARLPVHFE